MNKIKIIFAGTPDFAVPFLKSLIDDQDFEIVAVLTQPDKPTGRKQLLTPPPIKQIAIENNLAVLQPENLIPHLPEGGQGENIVLNLKELKADLMVVVAYGLLIPQTILDLFEYGVINVHPSLLPKYRGASPVQSAILSGDKETGVTIMKLDAKMDHGPILSQKTISLRGDETNQSLHDRIFEVGKDLLIETIKKYIKGEIITQEQDHDRATFCNQIDKNDAKIDWNKSAQEIDRQIRAFYPWPVTWTILENKRVKIFPPAFILPLTEGEIESVGDKKTTGKLFLLNGKLAVECGENAIVFSEVQFEGKNKITSTDFIRGHRDMIGKKFE